jgi:hypothetical protein
MNELRIISWNARSLNELKKHELQAVIEDFKIDIISVSEAKRSDHELSLVGYSFFRCDEDLIVYVSDTILKEVSGLECFFKPYISLIKFRLLGYILFFAYCRDGSSEKGISSLLTKSLKERDAKCIIMGDLNARSSLYDSESKSNQAGRYFDHFMTSHSDEFFIMNDTKSPTFFKKEYCSLLDYCIATSPVIPLVSECLTTSVLLSDHKAVLLTLGNYHQNVDPCDYSTLYPVRSLNLRVVPEKKQDKFVDQIDKSLQS